MEQRITLVNPDQTDVIQLLGEKISQLEHMSQAAQFALSEGFDDEVVLAAFFHDIGHICLIDQLTAENSMGGCGVKRHESLGAEYLKSHGFSDRLAKLVENHVNAKRYLCYKEPQYFNKLSCASKTTLEYQGGLMSQAEAKRFEEDPDFNEMISIRRWDERAKEEGVPLIDLEVLKRKAMVLMTK